MSGVQLHHSVSGTGNPVIILHGLFGSSRNWHSMSKKLAEHYLVVNADLRNHGKSQHADTMSYPEMAEDVFAMAESLGLSEYSVIGHSMGGKVAMQMALERPDIIRKIVVLDIAPVKYQHRYGKLFAAMNNLPLCSTNNRKEIESLFCSVIGDSMLCQFLLQNLVRKNDGFSWRINLSALENNIERISSFPETSSSRYYNRPCLFLGGNESEFILSRHQPVIKQLFPEAEIQWLEEAGHMLHVERPDAVMDIVRQFINK